MRVVTKTIVVKQDTGLPRTLAKGIGITLTEAEAKALHRMLTEIQRKGYHMRSPEELRRLREALGQSIQNL